MSTQQKRTIFISAAETSGDIHAAKLVRQLSRLLPSARCVGLGGSAMTDAGCSLLENLTDRSAMLHHALGQVRFYFALLRRIKRFFRNTPPDLVVLVDSPAWNFHVARLARRFGIPVLYYIAPQLWAWAPWRIHKLKRCCDKLACILPFEKEWFTKRGVDAEFVSNPLFDESDIDLQKNYKSYTKYNPKAPKIALLPGSRDAEIHTLWPAMLDAAIELKKRHPGATFTACAPDEEKLALLQDIAEDIEEYGIKIKYKSNALIEVTRKSDFALVASGSATLQVAAAGCPMTIMYQSNKLVWHLIGRWLIRLRFLSLVNILAHQELVPEFMPYFSSIEPVIEVTHKLLCAPSRLAHTSQALVELIRPLTERRASDAVADIAINMLGIELNEDA